MGDEIVKSEQGELSNRPDQLLKHIENVLPNLFFSDKEKKLIEILLHGIHNNNFTVKLLSKHYKFNDQLLDEYGDLLDWDYLSENLDVEWSEGLIEKHIEKWNWDKLSSFHIYSYSHEFIAKYENKWNWEALSANTKIKWTEDLFNKYQSRVHWNEVPGIVEQEDVFFTSDDFIIKYQDKINWENLSSCKKSYWPLHILDRFASRFDWSLLSQNESLHWSIEFIDRYKDKLDWHYLSEANFLPWSIEFIESFVDFWNYEVLLRNEAIPWTMVLVRKYAHKYNEGFFFGLLFKNEKWDVGSVQEYISLTNCRYLESIEALPIDVLRTFKKHFKPGLLWRCSFITSEIIAEFQNELNWDDLSSNVRIDWSDELIDEYIDKWHWDTLSCNSNNNWNIERLYKYKSYLDFETLFSKYFYYRYNYKEHIEPFISEKVLKHVIKKIQNEYSEN
jgi:hypothetical protein